MTLGKMVKAATKMSLPMLVVASALPVFGMGVDFNTTGMFTCGIHTVGCVTSNGGASVTITNNGNTLNMTAIGFTDLNVMPNDQNPDVNGSPLDDVNVITFDTTSTNHPTPAGGVNTAGLTFTLMINQTVPDIAPTSGALLGAFSGSIDARGSNTVVNFASNQTSLTLGGNITYTLDFLNPGQNSWTIPNPGIGKTGITTETATVTPEPSFLILSGFGFAGLAFMVHRRRQKASV
jgi:hypothetical protein